MLEPCCGDSAKDLGGQSRGTDNDPGTDRMAGSGNGDRGEHFAVARIRRAARSIRRAFTGDEEMDAVDHDRAQSGLSRVERLGSPDDVGKLGRSSGDDLRPIEDRVSSPDHRAM